MDKILKGNEGELEALSIITKAISVANIKADVFNNVIIEFPSIYGRNAFMTTELDHVVITPFLIFIVETKNEDYKNYKYEEMQWTLLNDEKVSNPLIQNQLHKKVFCSELGIDLNKVLTIEYLIKCTDMRIKSRYPNDYICTRENFLDCLILLFTTSLNEELDENLNARLSRLEYESKYKIVKHIETLSQVERIENWTRTHEGHYNFSRTDISICPKCGGRLVFKPYKGKDYSRNNVRVSQQYLIGCVNFNSTGCDFRKYYSKENGKGFDDIRITSLEDRNRWKEMKEVITILDTYIEQQKMIDKLKRKLLEKDSIIERERFERQSLECKFQNIQEEMDKLQQENKQYSHLIGPLYYK